MTDIVERLREGEDGLEYAAADEIERLRAERDMWRGENAKKQTACEQMGVRIVALEAEAERLRAALRAVEAKANQHRDDALDDRVLDEAVRHESVSEIARAALAKEPGHD